MPPAPTSPDDRRNSAADRTILRRRGIAARESLPAAEHAALSTRIEAHLLTWLENMEPALLGFCWPIRAEFDARPLVLRLLARGWRAALPMVVAVDAPMIFRSWKPDSELAIGRHGLPRQKPVARQQGGEGRRTKSGARLPQKFTASTAAKLATGGF
jgi:5-formyltetrahydrofolate cyclo-ligase